IDVLFVNLPVIGYPFTISMFLFFISLLVLAVARLNRQPPSELNIEFSNRIHEGGSMNLSYSLPNGKRRVSLPVKEARALPGQPLARMAHFVLTKAKGTKSSLVIVFKRPRIYLQLGFETDEEMEKVYRMLS
ncbi:MAG TPA: hypothetical protein VJR06_06755, partial [Nitrososphaerales archaeon]|nr:hypothetical protein [Nitrososphaerales archaeon]